ncbi:MAG: hypothetical protein AB1568_09140 [Thermodesulfobacteriota bacterium]
MHWRRLNNAVHRDLGYFFFGLTVIYAVSGVAVNHLHQWNPNYHIERRTLPVDGAGVRVTTEAEAQTLLRQLGIDGKLRSFLPAPGGGTQIFVDDDVLTVSPADGTAVWEQARPRPLLYPMNFLHLNHPKKAWTWMADIYAVGLAILAGTGLFVLKGRNGISGRGAVLSLAGLALPALFWLLYL